VTADTSSTAPSVNAQSRRTAIFTVSLLIVCQSFQALVFGGVGLFLPLIRSDLDLTFTQGGTFSAASTLVYAFMQIPAGYLVDRFGPKRLFFIGAIGTNVLGFAFASLESYPLMVLSQAAAGFFRSLLFAPGLVLMASWFPPNRRATAMGLYISGGFTSNIVLNLVGPSLASRYGWQMPFLLFSSLGLLMALAYGRFAQERTGSVPGAASVREALSLFRYRVMWVIGGIQYIRFAVALGIGFWMPTFLHEQKGFSLETTGLLIALGALLTVPSNFLGGYASDRLRNPLLVIGGSLGMLAVTTLLIVAVDNTGLLIAAMCVNSIFIQFYFGALFAVPVEILGPRRAGISSGFSNFFANVGGFSFTYTIGALKDATGSFDVGFYALAGCCVAGIALTLILAAIRKRWVPPTEATA
jgi:DHA1 family inner membrane transport protein